MRKCVNAAVIILAVDAVDIVVVVVVVVVVLLSLSEALLFRYYC